LRKFLTFLLVIVLCVMLLRFVLAPDNANEPINAISILGSFLDIDLATWKFFSLITAELQDIVQILSFEWLDFSDAEEILDYLKVIFSGISDFFGSILRILLAPFLSFYYWFDTLYQLILWLFRLLGEVFVPDTSWIPGWG